MADDLSDIEYRNRLNSLPGLKQIVERHANPSDECEKFLRMELVLDGLYHNNVIARAVAEANIRYGDILNDMLKGM
jgi:magnesium chelatase subunit I